MRLFIDTSAFYAIMDAGDDFHSRAKDYFSEIIEKDISLSSSNYVIVETIALVQNRLSISAARLFINDILPVINLHYIDEDIHDIAINNLLSLSDSKISMVDFTSFKLMRDLEIDSAFTFDRHFKKQGFEILPG
jgi:predicted nucleic acid-binding protein